MIFQFPWGNLVTFGRQRESRIRSCFECNGSFGFAQKPNSARISGGNLSFTKPQLPDSALTRQSSQKNKTAPVRRLLASSSCSAPRSKRRRKTDCRRSPIVGEGVAKIDRRTRKSASRGKSWRKRRRSGEQRSHALQVVNGGPRG